jgi:cephalosporin hydroxylase
MYPFWDNVVLPVLTAAGAKRIVEIGALRGDTTVRMLEGLGPNAELHVIDPVPAFDPTEHEQRFGGKYVFHRDLSHNVLPTLPAMDAALVDGDHNWFTVYHELKLLAAASDTAGIAAPVLILHDVGWPYGRRDLYYAPEQIPEEFRQPYAQKGILRGRSELVPNGGANPTMWNATHEGGPRNGVMTALDDFVAERERPMRVVVLPVYYGLAIAVEIARLEQNPALGEVLDRLESAEGQATLARLAEDLRLETTEQYHGLFFNNLNIRTRGAQRYLELLKKALLNEHYLEHELRIHQLARSVENGNRPYGESLRDPARQWNGQMQSLLAMRRAGKLVDTEADVAGYFPYTTMGRARLDALEQCLDTIREQSVDGDLIECTTGRGGGGIFLRAYLDAYEMNRSTVWIADTFRSAAPGTSAGEMPYPGAPPLPGGGVGFPELQGDLHTVRDGFARFDLLDDRVRFLAGPTSETLPDASFEKLALIVLGDAVRGDAGRVLDALYDKLAVGGFVVIDRFGALKCRDAVDEFRARRGITEPIERIDSAAAMWRKTQDAPAAANLPPAPKARASAIAPTPLAPPLPKEHNDLSVVVVFYNMRRAAERTLHSLSRAYQRGLEGVDYEVIAIENGSDRDQKLGAEFVQSFGREFRYIDMGDDASASPVPALNAGIADANGESIALMIDGAHVLTPGVLRFGLTALRTYEPAIVSTQQWWVGPGEQGDMLAEGYDEELQDQLFNRIQWPTDGYRLFDIGNFIGERDWLDGMWETNCLFAPRKLLEQVGGFDESFSEAGGGYANLEIFERLGSSPDVTVATILGEGSFHQAHGGATTNLPDLTERHDKLGEHAAYYEQVRGRPFRGPRKVIHYVGTMLPEAARTRPRRRALPNLFKRADPSGIPAKPTPMPNELRAEFVEAYWNTLAWQQTTWMGHEVPKPPTDLFAYQELISAVEPDWIIETGTGTGGRALFLASICDLHDSGRVISVDARKDDARPAHPRITYVKGDPANGKVVKKIRQQVGADAKGLVILGTRGTAGETITQFRLYEQFVPVGSYVVIEDTVVNGHPVWPDFGPGPAESVKGVVESRGDFVADLSMGKYGLSFNPGGFLKRVRAREG